MPGSLSEASRPYAPLPSSPIQKLTRAVFFGATVPSRVRTRGPSHTGRPRLLHVMPLLHARQREDILVAVETTDTGGTPTTTTTRYVHGPGIDEPLLVEDGGQGYAVHADALGSVTGLSDASQTVAEASTYTSFGALSRSGTPTRNPYAYTGREWEPELGLVLLSGPVLRSGGGAVPQSGSDRVRRWR